jgi:hypothetical protein
MFGESGGAGGHFQLQGERTTAVDGLSISLPGWKDFVIWYFCMAEETLPTPEGPSVAARLAFKVWIMVWVVNHTLMSHVDQKMKFPYRNLPVNDSVL